MRLTIRLINHRLHDELLEQIIRLEVNVQFYSSRKSINCVKDWDVLGTFKDDNTRCNIFVTKFKDKYIISCTDNCSEAKYYKLFTELANYFSSFVLERTNSYYAKLSRQDLINKKLIDQWKVENEDEC